MAGLGAIRFLRKNGAPTREQLGELLPGQPCYDMLNNDLYLGTDDGYKSLTGDIKQTLGGWKHITMGRRVDSSAQTARLDPPSQLYVFSLRVMPNPSRPYHLNPITVAINDGESDGESFAFTGVDAAQDVGYLDIQGVWYHYGDGESQSSYLHYDFAASRSGRPVRKTGKLTLSVDKPLVVQYKSGDGRLELSYDYYSL